MHTSQHIKPPTPASFASPLAHLEGVVADHLRQRRGEVALLAVEQTRGQRTLAMTVPLALRRAEAAARSASRAGVRVGQGDWLADWFYFSLICIHLLALYYK